MTARLSQRRTRRRGIAELAAAAYLRYCRYFDAWFREPVDAMTAIDQLAFLRRNYLSNAAPVVGYRIARWKRRAVTAMLDGPAGPPRLRQQPRHRRHRGLETRRGHRRLGHATRCRPGTRPASTVCRCLAIEDGFLRSVGLGAAFVQPISLVFDSGGLYFDPSSRPDIETLLNTADGQPRRGNPRADRLQRRIVAGRITKYNVMKPAHAAGRGATRAAKSVLVPGQVAR